MSCLIKMCLDGNSKSYEYNRSYIDIPIYDQEFISLPDIIRLIKTETDNTKVTINSDLVKSYEILTENIRFKTKNNKKVGDINLNQEHCKLILYPKKSITYHDNEIDCYAVLIWHIDRDTLRIIDRSCRF